MYEYHPYDMPNSKDWTSQNQLVTNELGNLPAKLSNPGVPVFYGEYSLYYNDDVWSRFMAGLNASSVSWSAWTYKVKGTETDGFAYWGMYFNNQKPVPVINSDDSATFISKVQQFGTAQLHPERPVRGDALQVRRRPGHVHAGRDQPQRLDGHGVDRRRRAPRPADGIDGVNASAWATGQAMAGGEWYRIDMGSNQTVAMVIVQTPSGSKWDYPRGLHHRDVHERHELVDGRDRHRLRLEAADLDHPDHGAVHPDHPDRRGTAVVDDRRGDRLLVVLTA